MSSTSKQTISNQDQPGTSKWIGRGRGDIMYMLASLFLRVMQLLSPSQRMRTIDKVSDYLGHFLYSMNAQ